MGLPALHPFPWKARSGVVLPLKTHLPQPSLNPRTLGKMASTLTTIPPRTYTETDVQIIHFQSAFVTDIVKLRTIELCKLVNNAFESSCAPFYTYDIITFYVYQVSACRKVSSSLFCLHFLFHIFEVYLQPTVTLCFDYDIFTE
jgi:hypothetical protein